MEDELPLRPTLNSAVLHLTPIRLLTAFLAGFSDGSMDDLLDEVPPEPRDELLLPFLGLHQPPSVLSVGSNIAAMAMILRNDLL